MLTVKKEKVDMCCLGEVRWRGQGARFVGCRGRRYKLWWPGKDDGIGRVGILVKKTLQKDCRSLEKK